MKWRNEELSNNEKIRLVFISVSVVIFILFPVFVSIIYLTPIYEKYKIEKAMKEKILAEKEKDEEAGQGRLGRRFGFSGL